MDEASRNTYRGIAKELALNAAASPSTVVDMKNITEALCAAYADGQRAGMERAATLCEGEALIDDERGYYGVEMGKAIRAKAAVHETI